MEHVADDVLVGVLRESNPGTSYSARPPARLGLTDEHVVVEAVAGQVVDATFTRAVAELRAFAAAQSPYLVRLLDAGQQDGCSTPWSTCAWAVCERPRVP